MSWEHCVRPRLMEGKNHEVKVKVKVNLKVR